MKNKAAKDLLYQGKKLRQEGKLEEAIAATEQVIQIYPDYVPAHFQLAEIYESSKKFDRAFIHYQYIVQIDPHNDSALAKLASVMMKQGDILRAISTYQQAIIKKSQQPAWVYGGLGKALSQNEQIEEAIVSYQKAIELKPDNPNFYVNLAQLYLKKGNLNGLIESYQQAIKLKPNLPLPIYQKLAEALNQQGRKDEATTVIKSAPQIDFKDGETYLKIWKALNQTSLKTLEEEQ